MTARRAPTGRERELLALRCPGVPWERAKCEQRAEWLQRARVDGQRVGYCDRCLRHIGERAGLFPHSLEYVRISASGNLDEAEVRRIGGAAGKG